MAALVLFEESLFDHFILKDDIYIIISIRRGAVVGMMILFTRDIFLFIDSTL